MIFIHSLAESISFPVLKVEINVTRRKLYLKFEIITPEIIETGNISPFGNL